MACGVDEYGYLLGVHVAVDMCSQPMCSDRSWLLIHKPRATLLA